MGLAPYMTKARSRHADEVSSLRRREFVFIFAWWAVRSRSPRGVAHLPARTPPRSHLAAARPARLTTAPYWGWVGGPVLGIGPGGGLVACVVGFVCLL